MHKVSKIYSVAFNGINVIDVEVQVQIIPGIPCFTIVGLADKTIAESKERVRAALLSIGLSLPAKKILVNLAPADLIKEGSHFDLAIACALISALGVIPNDELQEYLILGELSLDASLLSVNGILPAAIGASSRGKGLICPKVNGREAAWSRNNKIIAASNLLEIINHFKGTQVVQLPEINEEITSINYADLSDIKGQKNAKRALEIAAAGGHNLLMFGPPGSGKSMLAQRLPGLLPSLSTEEILECSMVASVAGLIANGKLSNIRPFRAPHHSCSVAAMVGGGMGRRIKPGEISLAHNGVLFLDELPEFPAVVIEALRQPIEAGEILIARSGSHIKYPANFQFIAAMNPCKCGYIDEPLKSCSKAPRCSQDYLFKISGPILDRFDLHVHVPMIDIETHLNNKTTEESSKDVASRVFNAREKQLKRYDGYGIKTNSNLNGQLLTDYAIPQDGSLEILNQAANKFKLSMRSYNKILKVARTIADLANEASVHKGHIAEALSYRQMNYFNK
jgi:magnesium chelatase family protein